MLSTDSVAVERIERVGTKRFFKTMLAVLHLSFDCREPDYACAVWTIASIIKACSALECRGVDSTGIQGMLADSAHFVIEYLRRCTPSYLDLHQTLRKIVFLRFARDLSSPGERGGSPVPARHPVQ
jgi:hypothetical protein